MALSCFSKHRAGDGVVVYTDLQQSSPEISNHNGFIVKYTGNGLMAVFPEGVDHAVQARILKLEQLQKFNQNRIINGRFR